MGNEPPASSRKQGRLLRAALVFFPVGTVIFGIASFGIWWQKRQHVEARSFQFAAAVRQDLNAASVERYVSILRDVLSQPEDRRLPAVASFLDSSMGAENMGYAVRREPFQAGGFELANVDVELTGKHRPREIILVLAPYGDRAKLEAECHALAALMSLAHAVTGENRAVTLRFAGVPIGVKDNDGRTGLERFAAACRDREERLMQVHVLGGPSEANLQDIRKTFRAEVSGTVVHGLPATVDTPTTLAAAAALKTFLMGEIAK
ncbi:MAG: hypothetical protein U0984_07025 [Prosthecobacter sp.]|nr:hypothetical protein [Prosthecobacter sp.]